MGRIPALEEIRDVVAREWTNEKRKALQEGRLQELLKRYEVVVGTSLKTAGSQ